MVLSLLNDRFGTALILFFINFIDTTVKIFECFTKDNAYGGNKAGRQWTELSNNFREGETGDAFHFNKRQLVPLTKRVYNRNVRMRQLDTYAEFP